MRIQITFNHNKGVFIPYDYQYAVQSWLYHLIHLGNKSLAEKLHDEGFQFEGKTFKLFGFSPWNLYPYENIQGKGFKTKEDKTSLEVSFLLPGVLKTFIMGLFQDKGYAFFFPDQSSVKIHCNNIILQQEPNFYDGILQYRLVSGARISLNCPDQKYPLYIGPDHTEYSTRFIKNLINKYESMPDLEQKRTVNPKECHFECTSSFKTKKYNVLKDGNLIESKTWLYDFNLNAPAEIHRTLYFAGAGEEGSLGLGWVKILNQNI